LEIGLAKLVPDAAASLSRKSDQQDSTEIHLAAFHGSYGAGHNPRISGVSWNGLGWDAGGGLASDIIVLVVDRPDFIELHVSPRRRVGGRPPSSDAYQAMIGGNELALQRVVAEQDEIVVRFQVSERVRAAAENQVLFLCFSRGYKADDRESERFLYSVRWK
jgi:hypothetical protein